MVFTLHPFFLKFSREYSTMHKIAQLLFDRLHASARLEIVLHAREGSDEKYKNHRLLCGAWYCRVVARDRIFHAFWIDSRPM